MTSTIEVKGLALNLSGGGSHQVFQTSMDGYGPAYVDLETTKAGQYQLHLVAQVNSLEDRVVAGTVTISVIPDDDQVLDPANAQGFTVLANPALPTFEELRQMQLPSLSTDQRVPS